MKANRPTPQYGWTCFHCGQNFISADMARDHFGPTPDWKPRCIEVNGTHGGLVDEIRDLRARNLDLIRERNRADEDAEMATGSLAGLARLFKGARTPWEVWQQFDSLNGRVIAAEAIIKELEQRFGGHAVQSARDAVCEKKVAP